MPRYMHCHNALCKRPHALEPEIVLHQEHDTGAWVPDCCPQCGEDIYDESLEDAAEEPLAAILDLTNRELSDYDVLDLLTALANEVARQDERRRRRLVRHQAFMAGTLMGPEPKLDLEGGTR